MPPDASAVARAVDRAIARASRRDTPARAHRTMQVNALFKKAAPAPAKTAKAPAKTQIKKAPAKAPSLPSLPNPFGGDAPKASAKTVKKAAPAKKAVAKKAPVKKAPVKKAPVAKKAAKSPTAAKEALAKWYGAYLLKRIG